MDWIRQNTFLATFGGIMLLGTLGLGFFAFSSWKGYSAAVDNFQETREKLTNLEAQPLHPNPENVQMVKTEVDAYEKSVADLFSKLQAEQKPLPADGDVTKFGSKIESLLIPLQEKAMKQGITLGANFGRILEVQSPKRNIKNVASPVTRFAGTVVPPETPTVGTK